MQLTAVRKPQIASTRNQKADATGQAATAPAAGFEVKKEFQDAASAVRYLQDDYLPGLDRFAKDFEAKNGRKPSDQDFPVEVVRMVPPHPKGAPILVVGGMGPLAGAQAFEEALRKFGDEREVVLLQLCSTPDRTAALKSHGWKVDASEPQHGAILDAMKDGFTKAEGSIVTRHQGKAHMFVACNTAHNFVPQAVERYEDARGQEAELQFDSMVKCVTDELASSLGGKDAPVVILGTDGTKKTKLYVNPLTEKNVKVAEPDDASQQDLMDAIYKGVKAFDTEATVRHGEALFKRMAETGQIDPEKGFVVLAGCTEVPQIVADLQAHGSPEVKKILEKAQVASPVSITLDHIARADAKAAATPTGLTAKL